MKRFLLATLAVITIIGMLVSSCGETAPAEAPEAPAPEAVAVPGVPEAPEAAAPEAAAPTTGPKYGGTVKILTLTPPDANMGWPVDVTWKHMQMTRYIMMEFLIRYNRDATIEPMLATDWEFAPDLSSITFYLREGVKFHDGTEFKADAVKLMIDANIEAGEAAAERWESADIIDDYTVRLNLEEFDNALWQRLNALSCMIVSPTAYETNGVEWMRTHPVGTGPFTLAEFNETEGWGKFERFDDYWQEGKPYLDGVELIHIADPVTLEIAFLAGEGNVASYQGAKVLYDMEARGYNIVAPLMGVPFILPDNDPDSPFADKMVREAIEYALDKEGMAQAAGYGHYAATYQYCFPGHPCYNPDIVGREYDPDEARRLLALAGLEGGFKTTLIYDSYRIEPVLFVQRCLEEVGIKVEMKYTDMMAIYEVYVNGWSGLLASGVMTYPNWASGFMMFPPYGDQYASFIIPEGLPELVLEAVSTPDLDEMIELNQQCLKLIADEAVLIPIWADSLGYVLSPKIHDHDFLVGHESCDWRPDNAWMEE